MNVKIVTCGSEDNGACVGDWTELSPTGDRMIRYCSECMRAVYCCESEDEVQSRQAAGQCVARAL